MPLEHFVFLDESGLNLGMTPTHGRCPKGERLSASKPSKRGQNISLVGAMKKDGLCALYPYDGAVDGSRFIDFLTQHLRPVLVPGDIVVMDNCRIHHIKEVKRILKKAGAKAVYLPPYTPELNPIEKAWSSLKQKIRKLQPRTISEMVGALNQARENLTPEKCYAFVKCAGYDPSFP